MNLKKLAAAMLMALVATACFVAYKSLVNPRSATAASLPRVPALDLPRPLAAGMAVPSRFAWEEEALEAAMMYFPDEMPVLEVVASAPSRDLVCALSMNLGCPVSEERKTRMPETQDSGDYYIMNADELGIDYFRDGNYGVTWNQREPFSHRPQAGVEAVGIDETVAAAQQFLDDTRLLPEGARFTQVIATDTNTSYNDTDRMSRTHVLVRSAIYRRFRNGFPEGSFAVGVNSKGQVCSMTRNMRDVRVLGAYPILSPAEAADAILTEAARLEGLPSVGSIGFGEVRSAELEYYDGATAWRMDTVQPVYRLRGTAKEAASGEVYEFVATVPAVRPEYLEPTELPR